MPLVGEPDAATVAAIDKCVAVASDLGARVSAVAVEEDILVQPKVMISDDLDNTAAVEAVRSVSDAHGLLKAFDNAAIRFGVRNEKTLSRLAVADIPGNFATCARLRDLSLLPVKTDDGRSEKIVERPIFESGRPILMCPEEFAAELPVVFDHVVIAWDHTAPAARAVADALPILQSAGSVHIITATDNKTPEQLASGAAVCTENLIRVVAQGEGPGARYEQRSLVLYSDVSMVSINSGGPRDHPPRDARALASGGPSSLLALEVALSGRAAAHRDGPARADPADERRKSSLGRATHPRRTPQARV